MKQINNHNDKNWLDMLDQNIVDSIAEQYYSDHKKQFDDDCQYIDNFNAPKISIKDIEYRYGDTSDLVNRSGYDHRPSSSHLDGNDSKIETKKASYNTVLHVNDISDYDAFSEITEFFKNKLNLKNIYIKFVKQEPGRVVATHVDHIRKYVYDNRQRFKDVPVENISKYVYFLEDQKIGQMWSIGRNQIAWKAGDIYQWPWYMPHATANASDYDRHLLIITGWY